MFDDPLLSDPKARGNVTPRVRFLAAIESRAWVLLCKPMARKDADRGAALNIHARELCPGILVLGQCAGWIMDHDAISCAQQVGGSTR